MNDIKQNLPVIDFFDGTKYDFLSNFHPSPVYLEPWMTFSGLKTGPIKCQTVENAFQAAKATTATQCERIASATNPGLAKSMGRSTAIRSDWEEVKVDIMRQLVFSKFIYNLDLQQQLLGTHPAILIEGNTWRDRFWGVYKGDGLNWLGIILMETRNLLRSL